MTKLVVALLAFGITGTIPTDIAYGCEGKTTIFEDKFADDTGGWYLGPTVQIEQSSLQIKPAAKQNSRTLNLKSLSGDADICADVVFTDSGAGQAAGLMVWATDYANFYTVQIEPNGNVSVWRLESNKWLALHDSALDKSVKRGSDKVNVLRVKATASEIAFFVNDVQIRKLKASAPGPTWRFGVYGQNNIRPKPIVFKRVKVTGVDSAPGAAADAGTADTYRKLNLFGDVFERVRSDYATKPDETKLVEAAIKGMLATLDPQSSYLDPKAFREMQVQTRSQFGGAGIEVRMDKAGVRVVTAFDGAPASKAGILPNDIITMIDDESLSGFALEQAVERLRGPVNSKVKLTVSRSGQVLPIEVTISRAIVHVPSVVWRLDEGDVAYIKLRQFNELTTERLKQAFADIAEKIAGEKLRGYVLDLRNNTGGLLDQVISVSDAFLQKGEIVSTRGRTDTERYNARPGDLANGKALIVLINGGTASGAEILAAALRDHKRATTVGTRTYGLGSIQTIIPLGSGNGGLKLTTSHFHTPTGKNIEGKGIEPDIEVAEAVPPEIGEDAVKGKPGLQSYVPAEQKDDKALNLAFGLLRGTVKNSAFPPK